MTHLDALNLRLSNERMRLQEARNEKEKAWRRVWIAQIEKEIHDEYAFLKQNEMPFSDDELLNELAK